MESQKDRLLAWRPETVVIPQVEFMLDTKQAIVIASAITANNLIKKFMAQSKGDDK